MYCNRRQLNKKLRGVHPQNRSPTPPVARVYNQPTYQPRGGHLKRAGGGCQFFFPFYPVLVGFKTSILSRANSKNLPFLGASTGRTLIFLVFCTPRHRTPKLPTRLGGGGANPTPTSVPTTNLYEPPRQSPIGTPTSALSAIIVGAMAMLYSFHFSWILSRLRTMFHAAAAVGGHEWHAPPPEICLEF